VSEQDKLTLRQVEDEIRRRKMVDPLKHVYTPHEFQLSIHKSRVPITLVLGGNRTGKSYAAVAEAILYCLGRSTYAETPDPPVNVWYVMPTTGQFVRNIEPILNKLLPQQEISSQNKRDRMYRFKNGSTLHFMSADMRQRRLAGASVDLVIVDEPINHNIFVELQARIIDRRGRILLVMTPVDDKPDTWLWVRDELYIPWETEERKDVAVIYMPVADSEGNPCVPHFTREDIQRMEEQWPDPNVRAARMYGHFVTRTGLVFGTFDPALHVITRFDYPDTWHKWIMIDPQYHRFACLFFVADPDGNYYITDEYYSQDEPLAHRSQRIKSILGRVDKDVPCYVDSANPQDIAELNWHFGRIGAQIGAMAIPMRKRIEQMVLRVHSMLEPVQERQYSIYSDRRKVYGAPRLTLFHDLISTWNEGDRKIEGSRLVWELRRLTWDNQHKPDKNSAGGADCIDALIYGCSIPAVGRSDDAVMNPYAHLSPTDAMIMRQMDRMDQATDREEKWRFLQ